MNCPQRCPSCRRSLRDLSVPIDKLRYQRQFTLALSDRETGEWICPHCEHRWTTLDTPPKVV